MYGKMGHQNISFAGNIGESRFFHIMKHIAPYTEIKVDTMVMILRIELISLSVGLENRASNEHKNIERITVNTSNSCLEYKLYSTL